MGRNLYFTAGAVLKPSNQYLEDLGKIYSFCSDNQAELDRLVETGKHSI